MWQLRMHCNLSPSEPRQSFSALITTPCQVWSCWTYPLLSRFATDSLHYFTLWPWPLTFDLKSGLNTLKRKNATLIKTFVNWNKMLPTICLECLICPSSGEIENIISNHSSHH